MWRVSEDDLEAYLERCYQETQERIAAGTIKAEASRARIEAMVIALVVSAR